MWDFETIWKGKGTDNDHGDDPMRYDHERSKL